MPVRGSPSDIGRAMRSLGHMRRRSCLRNPAQGFQVLTRPFLGSKGRSVSAAARAVSTAEHDIATPAAAVAAVAFVTVLFWSVVGVDAILFRLFQGRYRS